MQWPYAGLAYIFAGGLLMLAGVFGFASGHTYFFGRSQHIVELTASSDSILFWFVVVFYVFSGAVVALYGRQRLRDKDNFIS